MSLGERNLKSAAPFPDTSWGMVLAAGHGADANAAFAALCRSYWMPIYAALRRKRYAPADAEDLVQGFFLHLIDRNTVSRADPGRGRFRSFLLGALRRFLADDSDREQALKRGGQSIFVPIDIVEAESKLHSDADVQATLELQFDRQWAHTVVANALDALRAEYIDSGQAQFYSILQPCLNPSAEPPSYATLATQLDRNVGAVKVAVHRLRGRFREVLRREVECTVATARDIEDELAYLRDVLAADVAATGAP